MFGLEDELFERLQAAERERDALQNVLNKIKAWLSQTNWSTPVGESGPWLQSILDREKM